MSAVILTVNTTKQNYFEIEGFSIQTSPLFTNETDEYVGVLIEVKEIRDKAEDKGIIDLLFRDMENGPIIGREVEINGRHLSFGATFTQGAEPYSDILVDIDIQ